MEDFALRLDEAARREHYHSQVYGALARVERNPFSKRLLEELAAVESGSASFWRSLGKKYGVRIGSQGRAPHRILWLHFLRRVLGLRFVLKVLEYGESKKEARLEGSSAFLGKAEHSKIRRFIDAEEAHEERLSMSLFGKDRGMHNIRDIIFGMNDGLVEVLAAAVGFGTFLKTPGLVFLAGIIVAVSGTLSMGGGAYIATDYENKVRGSGESSALSAWYVGIFYIIGAIFPLLPFAAGLSGAVGVAAAIILTSIVLACTAAFIAVISNKSISRNIGKTLAISLGAAAVTILIGYYARFVLHLSI